MIHIGRSGAILGSFSEFEVRQGLKSGRFFPTDLGWKEGMPNWLPLSQFSEFIPAPPPLPEEPELEDHAPVPELADEGAGLPWDDRKRIGFFPAIVETVTMVLIRPTEAFSRMRITGSLSNPLLYNLLGGWFGLLASGIYTVLLARLQGPAPGNLTDLQQLFFITPDKALGELELFVIMGPVIVTVGSLVSSAVAHLFLMLAGGANQPYHVTLRVFCFAYGSTQLLQIFPLCGGIIAMVWLMVCCVVGLAIAHGTTTARSMAAMVLLLAACFACCVGGLFLAISASYPMLRPR